MRYHRILEKGQGSTTSPRTTTKKLLRMWPTKSATVRTTLTFHYSLISDLHETYYVTKNEKRSFCRIFTGKLTKKYRLQALLRKELGLSQVRKKNAPLGNRRASRAVLDLHEKVKAFYLRDDVTRETTGKKHTVTCKKVKKQRRLLQDSMKTLHQKFMAESPVAVSYSFFAKMRPFWVVVPTQRDRETCQCKTHENLQFMVDKLHQAHLITTRSLEELADAVVCNK